MKARPKIVSGFISLVVCVLTFLAPGTQARASICSRTGYKTSPDLAAANEGSSLLVTWDGEKMLSCGFG